MRLQERDQLDRKLIVLLETDARTSASKLARELSIARSTVNDRIARLEREGVIQGYTAIVAPDPDTSMTRAQLFLNCDRSSVKQIVVQLQQFSEVKECFSTSGAFQLSCMADVLYSEDLDALIDDIALISGVNDVQSQIILATKFSRDYGLRQETKVPLSLVK